MSYNFFSFDRVTPSMRWIIVHSPRLSFPLEFSFKFKLELSQNNQILHIFTCSSSSAKNQ